MEETKLKIRSRCLRLLFLRDWRLFKINMALRKASSYSKRTVVAYTRISKKKSKSYIKAVPPQKIVKFTMGFENLLNKGKLPHQLTVVSEENVQIMHNALEACRQYLNKKLDVGYPGQYLFKVIPFPHHIQRENKMLTGAGADRMQTGMHSVCTSPS